ncbi:MAG: SPOR domain-containing protein [Pseudomonadota bacterium]
MTNASDGFEEEYEEFDEYDDDEERGLSGLVVLLMGVVMLGAFFSVVWIAYQQGIKTGGGVANAETPYVAADPDPVKIETASVSDDDLEDREVYDAITGDNPEPVTVLAEGPEEPINRQSDDAIGDIAAAVIDTAGETADAAAERVEDLMEQDAANLSEAAETVVADATDAVEVPAPVVQNNEPVSVPDPGPATTQVTQTSATAAVNALSGSYLVQVGAFGSNSEAVSNWQRMQSRLGDYLNGKAPSVERADLGDRGVYHRLRIGPFATAEAAKDYCMGLKDRGQDCLIKPNG